MRRSEPATGALAMLIAPHVRNTYAIDVSETVRRGASAPNLELGRAPAMIRIFNFLLMDG